MLNRKILAKKENRRPQINLVDEVIQIIDGQNYQKMKKTEKRTVVTAIMIAFFNE